MYLLNLRIKYTSLFRIMDSRYTPERALTVLIELHTTDKAAPPEHSTWIKMASQPAASTPGIDSLEVPSFVWGYHAYKDIWEPANSETLELKWERDNCKDINAVTVVKRAAPLATYPRTLLHILRSF